MSNSFGKIFNITTFGESHGSLIGVVIDGCPSNIEISNEIINLELKKRKPNQNPFTSQRKELDKAQIISGILDGKTTGAPICILIENVDVKSESYNKIKDILRPSHANFTYFKKYGLFDHKGASRASARETASRVAAGAIAKQILKKENIKIYAYIKSIGELEAQVTVDDLKNIYRSSIYCPDSINEKKMLEKLIEVKKDKDSIGGIVEFFVENIPCCLGEPIYDKLNARLAYAMMSIPAAKGFEMGDGFEGSKKTGFNRLDLFHVIDDKVVTKTNNEGGILAGISSGMPLIGRIAFKPTPTIGKKIHSIDFKGSKRVLDFSNDGRYDTCLAIRAVPVVESICAIVLADFYLLNLKKNFHNEKARCKT